ncbi:MAG: hypothetical protein HY815_22080, partial [Candidatus Riflebacteria bacterium]|nr:hypothetical protein [Candidatus Riflebacteria bacterium]
MTRLLCLAILVAIVPGFALAQGLVFPNRVTPDGQPIETDPKLPPLIVKSIKVDTKIVEQVAKTHVDQTFHNPTQ